LSGIVKAQHFLLKPVQRKKK